MSNKIASELALGMCEEEVVYKKTFNSERAKLLAAQLGSVIEEYPSEMDFLASDKSVRLSTRTLCNEATQMDPFLHLHVTSLTVLNIKTVYLAINNFLKIYDEGIQESK